MWEQLTIVDTGSAFFVAPADDPDDWVVSFQQRADFPAREWAERMISLYNADRHHDRPRPNYTYKTSFTPEIIPSVATDRNPESQRYNVPNSRKHGT